MSDIQLTEKQSSVLTTAIEDAQWFRDEAAEMAEWSREELQRCRDAKREQWRIAQRAKRSEEYELEHYRACRLVAFLEKLKPESEG